VQEITAADFNSRIKRFQKRICAAGVDTTREQGAQGVALILQAMREALR
jgi:hypothetical protein